MASPDVIRLAHGGGGRYTHQLIEEVFLPFFGNSVLNPLDDSAVFPVSGSRLAFTTDSFVVNPLFFPGGDIGRLAVCGTVNDLAAVGARPMYVSLGLIIEEGFVLSDLKRIAESVRQAAEEAGVRIATGDTKVVEKGHCDGLFINTSGIGFFEKRDPVSGSGARPGDRILVNASLGRHGMAVVTSRAGLGFVDRIQSDVAPLNRLVDSILDAVPDVHAMRDATRGGLSAALNEIAVQSGVGIELDESAVPVDEDVRGACELLGFDPLDTANEGVMVFIVPENRVEPALREMKKNSYGKSAALIGSVVSGSRGKVTLKTRLGSRRIMDMPSGEQLPRIC